MSVPEDPVAKLPELPRPDLDAVKTAEITADAAYNAKFAAAEEARLAQLADDQKKQAETQFKAREADGKAFQARIQASEVRFTEGQKTEQVQLAETRRAAAPSNTEMKTMQNIARFMIGRQYLDEHAPGLNTASFFGQGPTSRFGALAQSNGQQVIAFDQYVRRAPEAAVAKPETPAKPATAGPEGATAKRPKRRRGLEFLPAPAPKPPSFATSRKGGDNT